MSTETEAQPQASTSTAGAAEASTSKATMIPIRLTSRADKHAIPESKFMVPSDWRRFQLSELINKVLENEQAIPFDFLIGEELLRSSLGGYAQSKGLTEVSAW
jgi:ribosome biogenesis protein YTM1